ncbi:hypothetical protein AVEN_168709-1 [Araneus ventricosus]|uniref:Uncharacterized protein n=1 Tax=Araneus ventricosus TaxID=182803 RepID=A0A4Y2SM74_ARAVE|nr:hypothetical protein AVEN_168709-1 [Araneus ventricosus]
MEEVYALYIASQIASLGDEIPYIYTESMSALMALNCPNTTNKFIFDIKKNSNRRKNFKFHWFKAHIGIFGKEKAAESAEKGTGNLDIDINLGIPISWINY